MCLNPRKVVNSTNRFTPGVSKPFVMVPCGKCEECVNTQRMEWQIRLYYEHLGAQATGFTLFFTLTYAPGKIPSLFISDDEGNKSRITDSKGRVIYCFNTQHIPAFIKRVRAQIDYDGKPIEIRHFICSEYGDSPDDQYIDDSGNRRNFSHRPHYHGLFFVRSTDGTKLDVDKTSQYIRQLIVDKWTYGRKTFTFGSDFTPTAAGVVDAAGPIGYCAKYLNKDLASDTYYHEVLDNLKESFGSETFKAFKGSLVPKHYQSQGLGRCCLDILDSNTLDSGYLPCPVYDQKSGIVVTRNLRMPQYLMRKVNYELDKESGTWYPTERGRKNLAKLLLSERNETIEAIRNFRMVFKSNILPDSIFTERLLAYAKNYSPNLQSYLDIVSLFEAGSLFSAAHVANYITLFRDRSYWRTNVHNDNLPPLASFVRGKSLDECLNVDSDSQFLTFAEDLFNLSHEPCQVHDVDGDHYMVGLLIPQFATCLLESYVRLYNVFNLSLRYFASLSRSERTAEYKRNRKLLKRGFKALNNKKSLHYA